MNYIIKASGIAIMCGMLASCATPPVQHDVQNTQVYPKDFDTTWTNLIQYFSSNNIQVKTIEKASGIIYAEAGYVGASALADCGQPGLNTIVSTAGQFNVFVMKKDDGSTKVTVNTTFTQIQQDINNQNVSVQCTSTGALEQEILSAL